MSNMKTMEVKLVLAIENVVALEDVLYRAAERDLLVPLLRKEGWRVKRGELLLSLASLIKDQRYNQTGER